MQDNSPSTSTSTGAATFAELVLTLPEPVRKYLLSRELADRRKSLYVAHKLSEKERLAVLHGELEVFFGELTLVEFADEVRTRLDWPDERSGEMRGLIVDVLGNVFLPAQVQVGDVVGMISEFGGDAVRFASTTIEPRVITFTDGVREVVRMVELRDLAVEMKRRIEHIIEMRLRELHDDLETKELFMKQRKTGGAELDVATADALIDALKKRSVLTRYVDEMLVATKGQNTAVETSGGSVQTNGQNLTWTPEKIKELYIGSDEERTEIAQFKKKFQKVTGRDPDKMLAAAAEVVAPGDDRAVDPNLVVAAMDALADDGLLTALSEDARVEELVNQYRNSVGMEIEEELGIERKMEMFLQVVLRSTGSFSESESARFAMRIVNSAKRAGNDSYVGLTYFDPKSGAFKWRDPIMA